MAQLTLTVPDAQVPRVLAAFASRRGKDVGDMTANDVRAELLDLVRIIVRQYEADEAAQAAREAVIDIDVS